ncbi:hypothetical protein BDN72DRAFT_784428 [Pluteus cervinus]|uniref:Uncharacterized protein n=1 Tax=Pluteus cervinus TaxID=181527 RepID=A0ACD3BGV3_9AGAR|nr:hypothetical protein BDN72DRAFT_784428 [Pluteus cervinus]
MSTAPGADKKGHICPPSNAKHPSDRWESLFVYSFICKFTSLRGKTEGLETPMDLENALLSREPEPILTKVLTQFILNLKPQTRNLSADQISTTVASVLSEYFKSSERTIFWNDDLHKNVDPFEGLEGGFFATDWDFKLKILRQLVELQLSHAPEIKAPIDRAWGVVHNKHKKKDGAAITQPNDSQTQEALQLIPIGQDSQRKRYWIADDSPRIYVSTNPWKITATFQTVASTREEYITTIEQLKSSAPPALKKGQKRTRLELAHLALISDLELRVEAIDAELARVQRVRKKIEQRKVLLAQAELRETRTRKRTQRPDYVEYNDDDIGAMEQDDDDYKEEPEEEEFGGRSRRVASTTQQRRSTRAVVVNKRESSVESWSHWRGERRSSRLGASPDMQLDEPPPKRVRTEVARAHSTEALQPINGNSLSNGKNARSSAAALKATEYAVEKLPGKKKSKFWIYAVEPIQGTINSGLPVDGDLSVNDSTSSTTLNGNGTDSSGRHTPIYDRDEDKHMDYDRPSEPEGSLSPMDSA